MRTFLQKKYYPYFGIDRSLETDVGTTTDDAAVMEDFGMLSPTFQQLMLQSCTSCHYIAS
jgi:hypothetical protein